MPFGGAHGLSQIEIATRGITQTVVAARSHWEENNDEKENTVYQIVNAFERLHKKEALNAEKYFNDFVNYRNKYPDLFTEAIRKRIMKTASSVALSFSKVNKSELIMLAKLDMALKKIN